MTAPGVDNQDTTTTSVCSIPAPRGGLKVKPLPPSPENTYVNIPRFSHLLTHHPNKKLVQYILHGLQNGFDIGFRGTFTTTSPPNNTSAHKHESGLTVAVQKEVARGHTAGPFPSPPFPHNHVSPLGAEPKPDGSIRLLMDLSQPHGQSINEFISKEEFPTKYVPFDLATDIAHHLGHGCLMSKIDIKHAYRLLPVRQEDWPLLVYFWKGSYYVDLKLPFGSRSSSSIFNSFADLLAWVLTTTYKLIVIHYSDDYLLFSLNPPSAHHDLNSFLAVLDYLDIPVARDKLIGPSTEVVYLGITINTISMCISIPPEKTQEILAILPFWCSRRTCTKTELLSLLGKLNFFAIVVRAGRLFVRRLITLSTTVSKKYHHITLNKDSRADIQWWREFLPHWNHRSLVPPPLKILSNDIMLFTDASKTIGLGAIYDNEWILAKWPPSMLHLDIDFKELFAIFAATCTWGHQWKGQRIVFVTDNKPITQIWSSGSSPVPKLMSLIRALFLFAAKNDFSISFKHIFGHYNAIADALSRFQVPRFRALAPYAKQLPTTIPPQVWTLPSTCHAEKNIQHPN